MNSHVPWIHGFDWKQVVRVITDSSTSIGDSRKLLEQMALEISHLYSRIDVDMEQLAQQTCVFCTDVCCQKATVWYDLKDLLFLYFSSGVLPAEQIYKTPNMSCSQLTPEGCTLPRASRPFICSWYICSEQKSALQKFSSNVHALLVEIDRIKKRRNELEDLYINLTC